jgi:ubiquinone/menaquinone biosynthesis C-methylase UbiE
MSTEQNIVKNYFEKDSVVEVFKTHSGYNYFSRRREVFKMLDKTQFKNVVDLGCGSGGYLDIKKKYNCVYFGIDFADNMISAAKEKAKELGIEEGVFLQVGDVEATPYADKSIDLVVAIGLIEYFKNPEKLIKEIKRILKKDGVLVIQSFIPNHYVESLYFLLRLKTFLLNRDRLTHKQYNKQQLDNLFSKNNFKLVDFAYSNFQIIPKTPFERLFHKINTSFSEKLANKSVKKYGFWAVNYIGKYQLID